MKLLATIKSVEITRTYPHQDGTFGNVYGVTIESGNDTIIAETFRTAESQKKAGIVPGAIGTATIAFEVRPWTDKQGKAHYAQDIKLERFELANTNSRTGEAATEAAPAAPAAPAADPAPAPQEPAGEQMPSDGVTF
jgi:hypothetical protein